MLLSDFDYSLPTELIADKPKSQRSASRLLHLSPNISNITHHNFNDLSDFLNTNDLLVFNNTKVIPARLYGKKDTGGQIEILVEQIIDSNHFLGQVRASKPLREGSFITINKHDKNTVIKCVEKQDQLYYLEVTDCQTILSFLEEFGEIPLPPYIKRPANTEDQTRYQTIYASIPGAVAAPTAGLHFDNALINSLINKGIQLAYITLHVGLGTFQPVRTNNITDHKMHHEYIEISEKACEQITATQQKGGRIIAVGTTTVRCLEGCYQQFGSIKPFSGKTNLFIYPGFEFQCIDSMITNFHLPKSSLLMLVSAFAGYNKMMQAYQEAIEQRYRFFSYGDAMYISERQQNTNT